MFSLQSLGPLQFIGGDCAAAFTRVRSLWFSLQGLTVRGLDAGSRGQKQLDNNILSVCVCVCASVCMCRCVCARANAPGSCQCVRGSTVRVSNMVMRTCLFTYHRSSTF